MGGRGERGKGRKRESMWRRVEGKVRKEKSEEEAGCERGGVGKQCRGGGEIRGNEGRGEEEKRECAERGRGRRGRRKSREKETTRWEEVERRKRIEEDREKDENRKCMDERGRRKRGGKTAGERDNMRWRGWRKAEG